MLPRFTGSLLVALALLIAPTAQAAPTVVGTDPTGDWGMEDQDLDPILAMVGPELGQDLVEASIESTGDTVNFILEVTSLPSNGGVPEGTRYVWDMNVDNEIIELDGKFTNYTRGACDPTSAQCPPPRDPGAAPFIVRGDCVTTGNVTTCREIDLVHATFDAAAATITIPVPKATLGGCSIGPSPNGFARAGESISAVPSAFFTYGAMPMDLLFVGTTVNVC